MIFFFVVIMANLTTTCADLSVQRKISLDYTFFQSFFNIKDSRVGDFMNEISKLVYFSTAYMSQKCFNS